MPFLLNGKFGKKFAVEEFLQPVFILKPRKVFGTLTQPGSSCPKTRSLVFARSAVGADPGPSLPDCLAFPLGKPAPRDLARAITSLVSGMAVMGP